MHLKRQLEEELFRDAYGNIIRPNKENQPKSDTKQSKKKSK